MKSNPAPAGDLPPDPSGQSEFVRLPRTARLGLALFLVYLLFYGGFVALMAFAPRIVAQTVSALGGVNVAIVYGMALIFLAFAMAIVYMILCRGAGEDGESEGGRA